MIEIGSSLRGARERRGIDRSRVEADTHIRARYLKALEDERFDLLPGEAYARAFLRAYADYLGLEAQLFVDAYDARFAPLELPPIAPQPSVTRPRPLGRYVSGAAVALGALLLALFAWRFGDTDVQRTSVRPTPPRTAPARLAPTPKTRAATTLRRTSARLVLTAERGRCWLEAHRGSRAGPLLYRGTLEQGRSLRLTGRALWIRLGAPSSLRAAVNGRAARLPQDTSNVLVTARGVRLAA